MNKSYKLKKKKRLKKMNYKLKLVFCRWWNYGWSFFKCAFIVFKLYLFSHFYIISMRYIYTKRKRKKKKKKPLGVYFHSDINLFFKIITSLFPSPCLCSQQEVRVGSMTSTPFWWSGGGVGCGRLCRRGNRNETELGTERSLRSSVKARWWGNLWL